MEWWDSERWEGGEVERGSEYEGSSPNKLITQTVTSVTL